MNQYIIEHPTRGVFVGWKDSSSTGERYPAFNWSKPRNHESTILFDTAEAAFTEIDRMPEGFHRGGIHPTAAKVVLEHEDDSFYVHHIDLADGTVISGIPDTIDEEDPLEEVQSMVGDLYPLFDMANATTVELDIEENPL
jgi:hypothetical protein